MKKARSQSPGFVLDNVLTELGFRDQEFLHASLGS